jgi:hypothetical protein
MTSDSGDRVADGVSAVVRYAGNPAPANKVVTAITAAGGSAPSLQADVADETEVAALLIMPSRPPAASTW